MSDRFRSTAMLLGLAFLAGGIALYALGGQTYWLTLGTGLFAVGLIAGLLRRAGGPE